MSLVPVSLWLDTTADRLVIRTHAAAGEGDVTLLALDIKPLSDEDKRRLAHVRDPQQAQPAPSPTPVTRR